MTRMVRTLLCCCLASLLVSVVCGRPATQGDAKKPADAAFPGPRVERMLNELIEVVNSGDRKQIDAFVQERFAKNQVVRDSWPTRCCAFDEISKTLSNIASRSGGLVVDSVQPQATMIVAFARTKIGAKKLYISLQSSAERPDQIENYQIVVMPPDMEQFLPKVPRATPFGERLKLARQALQKAADQDLFSGTFVVARHGKIRLSAAYGDANKHSRAANRLDTPFGIASSGKLFTAVAVAQLVAEGKLSYSEPISHYLPDYPNQAVASKITLHQLLTHTSGLGDIFSKHPTNIRLDRLADYYPLFANEPLLFEPGKGQAYSNTGFLVASMVVEHVSGEEFRHYLQKHIFTPAGMTSTGWYASLAAEPYTRDSGDDLLAPNPPWVSADSFYKDLLGGPAAGAGGEDSTAYDLVRFATALGSGKLLDSKNFNTLIQEGYGCQCSAETGHRLYAHTGGGPGVNTGLQFYVDQGLIVVFLSNYDPPFPQVLAQDIGDLLVQEDK